MPSTSLIVFSGDYDRAMAAFTIANGAAGEGQRVTMFFTFWGISLLRKTGGESRGFLERVFKSLMPVGPSHVPLSRLNFAGVGPRLLRKLIRQRAGQSLSDLMQMALSRGIDLIACEASLALLGIDRGELLDSEHLHVGDVHEFLARARESEICLFV